MLLKRATFMEQKTGVGEPTARYDKALRERIDALLQVRAAIGSAAFGVLMICATRQDRHAMWAVAAVCVAFGVFSAILARRVFGMMDRRLANLGFFAGNTVYVLALMMASRFARPIFFAIPM